MHRSAAAEVPCNAEHAMASVCTAGTAATECGAEGPTVLLELSGVGPRPGASPPPRAPPGRPSTVTRPRMLRRRGGDQHGGVHAAHAGG